MFILGKIASWFLGSGISAIGDQLNKAYAAKLTAKNNTEKLEAEQNIAQLTARQTVLVAEQNSRLTKWIRPAFALPFVVYNFKIIVIDKVLGLGTTDELPPEFWQLQMIVFSAYFLARPIEKWLKR